MLANFSAVSSAAKEILAQADEALERLDRLKTFLLHAAQLDDEDHTKWYFLTQEARAACIVGVLAELEALTRTSLTAINGEVNSGQHLVGDLVPCLRGLAGHTHFESLRASADPTNIWLRRSTVTTYESNTETACLPLPTRGPQPPLDGKTLTPRHFSRLWVVYGVSGGPIPDLSWSQTLQKLSGLRNDIAHGNEPFNEVFLTAGTDTDSIEEYLTQMTLFVIHLATSLATYVEAQDYLI